jgi:hypothetical protein
MQAAVKLAQQLQERVPVQQRRRVVASLTRCIQDVDGAVAAILGVEVDM